MSAPSVREIEPRELAARLAAGEPVDAVVAQVSSDDFLAAERYLQQTSMLRQLYLMGYLTLAPAS